MTKKDDAQLVGQYLSGDEKSLEILIKRYLKPIFSFVYKYVGNNQEAEDITQEIFVKAWQNLKKFDKNKKFKTWIFTIAKNTSIDWLKKKRAIPMVELPELLKDERNTIKDDLINGFEIMIKNLSPQHREVLTLYYDNDFNFREIAENLGQPLNTIKSRHRRAILRLKKLL
jgi:RNA polymerase sigma-70 factor (ECF subfamily)